MTGELNRYEVPSRMGQDWRTVARYQAKMVDPASQEQVSNQAEQLLLVETVDKNCIHTN